MKKISTMIIIGLLCFSIFSMLTMKAKAVTIDVSAQYSSFVNAYNNYKQIFGQNVVIGQTVERTLSGVINDPPAHYPWNSWAGQRYPEPPDGFSIRIETIQPDYVYKIIGIGFVAGSQPSASGWIQVNSPFKIEQTNNIGNITFGDGSYVHIYVNVATGRIDLSAKWYNWPALIDACAFSFAITIAKPGGTLPPFSYDTTRSQASYAFDTDTKRVVMFGGRIWRESDLKSDLWTFDPSTSQWASVLAGSGPSARCLASMSYNPIAKNFLVFGGGTISGEVSDTWTLKFTGPTTGTWTQILGAGPSVRTGAPMVYDSKNSLFVLFGGERYVYSLDETWVFDPSTNTWSNRNPSPSPSQRARAAMAYDAKSGKVLLFGGLNKGIGSLLSDTWLYDAAVNTWQQVTPATAPSVRLWPSLASDGNGVFYLFGGWSVDAGGGLGQYLIDTWKFDMTTMQWTQLFPSQSPIAQSQGALMHVGSGKFVLMNGWRDSPLGEVWFYDSSLNAWTTWAPAPDFEISVPPEQEYLVADPHSTTEYTVNVTSLHGFNQPVTLNAVYSSHELSGSFEDTVVTPPSDGWVTTTLTVSVLSEEIITHQIYITGTSGILNHTTTVSLHVPFMSVPYLSQGDCGWCLPTSLTMAMDFWGKKTKPWETAESFGLGHDDGFDMHKNLLEIKSYISSQGLGYLVENALDEVRLESLLGYGPVILATNWTDNGQPAYHVVVVTGFYTDKFFINDPSGALLDEIFPFPAPQSHMQIEIPWTDLSQFIDFDRNPEAIGITGTGSINLRIGVLNLVGGKSSEVRTIKVDHEGIPGPYIWESGAKIYPGETYGITWQFSSHQRSLDPMDTLLVANGMIDPNDGLVVNPTTKLMRYEFQMVFEGPGHTYIRYVYVDADPCEIVNPGFDSINLGEALGKHYGKYIITLNLLNNEGALLDQIVLPEIRYLPAAKMSVHSPANLFVTDPLGRSIGVDPATGEITNEIPDAFYSGPGTEPQVVMIPDPINGTYSIVLVGTATGDYTLTIEYITADQILTETFNGAISQLETQYYSAMISETGEMQTISWEHVFNDPKRGTMLKISTDDKYFQFTAPGKDFGVRHDAKMKILKSIIIICYEDKTMRLTAIADAKIDFCSAIAWDKQTRKCYLLIDMPNWRYGRYCE